MSTNCDIADDELRRIVTFNNRITCDKLKYGGNYGTTAASIKVRGFYN
ncbi:MAG: hypothetical protein WCS94_23805 [Verrucomicrobiota bacterium]